MSRAALGALGVRRAAVVHGDDGLDELAVRGTTHVAIWDAGSVHRRIGLCESFFWRTASLSACLTASRAIATVRGARPCALRSAIPVALIVALFHAAINYLTMCCFAGTRPPRARRARP